MSVGQLKQSSDVSSSNATNPPGFLREDSVQSSSNKDPLPSLKSLFNKYTKITNETSKTNPDRRRSSRKDDEPDNNEPRIGLAGIEAWFTKARIFSTSITNVTVYDIRNSFANGEKLTLSFKDFEHYIEELAKFQKIHPDVLMLRLKMCGDPSLEDSMFQYSVPEGSVDRALDAFRIKAENYKETFEDLSTEPYEEPVCFGGVRGLARKAKSQKEEESILTAKANEMMKKGDSTTELDALNRNFVYFSKNGNYFSDGRSIELTQLIKWMKQAGVIDGDRITAHDIGFLFKRLYTLTWKMYLDDLHQFFHELSLWKKIPTDTLFRQMRSCKPPASSSMSVIDISIPKSVVEVLKDLLFDTADDLHQNQEIYEPKSQDTPYGHTPNSRNRHFQDAMEEDMAKVHSTVMEDMKKKGSGGQAMMNMNNHHHHAHKSGDDDDKDDTFQEEKRGGKDLLTKRWDDAYPIGGMDGNHRPHMEQDLDKLMFGSNRLDESSSDDEEKVKKKIKAKYGMAQLMPSNEKQTAVPPLEEQFEKYKRFGEFAHENGITLNNIGMWFTLAGIIAQGITLFTIKDIEEKYNTFKLARDQGYMEYETFLSLLGALCEKNKKHTNVKELKDRLARSGPPRNVTISKEKQLDTHKAGDPASGLSSKPVHEEVEEFQVSNYFKTRYNEFSRFGEATVHDAYSIPGLSMLNANKWVKQSGLEKKGVVIGDVDVLYKQLFSTKLRISLQEFCRVMHALSQASTHAPTMETILEVLETCGPPAITEVSHTKVNAGSKMASRQSSARVVK